MLQFCLPSSYDELDTKPSSGIRSGMGDDSELYAARLASTPQQAEPPKLAHISGSSGTNGTLSRAHSFRSSSPDSPSSVKLASVANTSSTSASDAEDDNFPPTPQSKQSCGAYYVVKPSDGIGSPTPNRIPKTDNTAAFSLYPPITSFEEQHYFDRFLGRPVNDNDSLEDVGQRVQDIYKSHIGRLSANSVRCAIHYKEAVRERKRMRWYTARWEVAEVQRLHTLLRSLCEESETEFIMADRESRWLLDILVERQTLPVTAAQAEYTAATCDTAKKSLRLADAELAMLNGRATVQ
ncbi:hypothetical protein P692DRAFT_20873323 [Suillus brevipes Sb2]|nr:hypothetical protein P692DRAFT_20873323 [Suillus brevipes Sb2]